MEENASKQIAFKCTDFNSSTRVTVYAESIYMFYQYLVLAAEYHVDCRQTLQWRLLWQISGATNWLQK